MAELRIEELSAETVSAANNLSLKPGQEAFLEPVSYTNVEQQLEPSGSWPRVVRDGDEVVGYVMGAFDEEASAQGSGVGRFAVAAFADEARRRGFTRATVVWASGDAGPGAFFESVGFRVVGETPYGENIGALDL
jgi:GNAT superfamily N-acetyltransferase